MESKHRGDRVRRARRPHSQLFAVRLWKEAVAGGTEHRGSVRNVTSGAHRSFRDWSDLVGFLVAQMDDEGGHEVGQAERENGGT
jgi:hypothetical protein